MNDKLMKKLRAGQSWHDIQAAIQWRIDEYGMEPDSLRQLYGELIDAGCDDSIMLAAVADASRRYEPRCVVRKASSV